MRPCCTSAYLHAGNNLSFCSADSAESLNHVIPGRQREVSIIIRQLGYLGKQNPLIWYFCRRPATVYGDIWSKLTSKNGQPRLLALFFIFFGLSSPLLSAASPQAKGERRCEV